MLSKWPGGALFKGQEMSINLFSKIRMHPLVHKKTQTSCVRLHRYIKCRYILAASSNHWHRYP